jgi:hypothetical protein
VAGQVVLGQLGGGARVGRQPLLIGEQPGQHAMQPGALTGQQVRVDRLPQQRVPERVPVRAVRDQQLLRDHLPYRVLVTGERQPGRGADQLVVGPPPGGRGHPQHALRRVGEPFHPAEQQRGQPGGEPVVFGGPVRRRGQQLLRVVGVALGAGDDAVEDRGVHGGFWTSRAGPGAAGVHRTGTFRMGAGTLRVRQRGQVLGQGGRRQRAQRQGGHGGQALQFGQDRAERMAAVQIVGAVGADDRDPLGAQHPGQEREQVAG